MSPKNGKGRAANAAKSELLLDRNGPEINPNAGNTQAENALLDTPVTTSTALGAALLAALKARGRR
jgi:hypothetical protein